MLSLEDLGWAAPFEAAFRELAGADLVPARVAEEQRGLFRVVATSGSRLAGLSGKLRHRTASKEERPAVGDWVAVFPHPDGERATIHHVLPRRTALRRRSSAKNTAAQVVAANVDTVFLVTSLNREFNPRRIERFLAVVWESGASPVLLLNKADLADGAADYRAEAERIALGVPIHVLSARTGIGVQALEPYLAPGRTVALVGSSGVGKSTLINRLAGAELQLVREIREDDARGRHTTTSRELVVLPGGALLVDTPGVREIALWETDAGVPGTFRDIEALAAGCRFNDCRHRTEPGCAIRRALASGELDADRYQSWQKLQRELAFLARKQDEGLWLEEKRKWKRLTVQYRKRPDKRTGR